MTTAHRRSDRFQLQRASGALFACAALFLGAALVLAAAPARAVFIRVTDFVDDFDDFNGTCTLREALRSANGNAAVDACNQGSATQTDEVILPPGTHFVDLSSGANEDFAMTGDLDVRDDVVIRGAAADYSIIDVQGTVAVDRLFEIHDVATPVKIRNLTLRGGDAPDVGGVILNHSDLTLDQVEISGGRASRGAGVFNDGGDLTVSRSRIAGNHTLAQPSDSDFGGGIASSGVNPVLTIVDSEIADNSSEDDGGGVWALGTTLTIHRSRIVDNVTSRDGGGLFVEGGSFEVHYTEFSGNGAQQGGGVYAKVAGEIQRSALLNNDASVAGGGLFDEGGGFLRYSTVAVNMAPQGAGIFAASSQTLIDSDTIAQNRNDGVYNQSGAFFENTLIAANPGGNCTGAPPAFGSLNLEDVDSCGFVSSAAGPNFPNTDPQLGLFGDHGGPTPTFSLLPGSPAIDAVSSEIRINCQNNLDQRGHPRGRPRSQNGLGEDVFLCDIGAYEVTQPFVVDALFDAVDADPDDDLCLTATGECTLRAAIQQANALTGAVDIQLGPGTHSLSITGTGEDAAATGDLDLRPPLTLQGAGATQTIVDAQGIDRVFDVASMTFMEPPGLTQDTLFRDLTITGGDAGSGDGGGILALADIRLEGVVLAGGVANRGAALYARNNDRRVEIVDSTVTGNVGSVPIFADDALIERSSLVGNDGAGSNGGAGEFNRIRLVDSTVSGNHSSATGAFFSQGAIIESSAIVDNTGDFAPGGVFLLEESVFRNSVISENLVSGAPDNCALNPNAVTSYGYNVTDTDAADCTLDALTDQTLTDPLLGPLADNGGPTETHLPLAGSPLIDTGDDTACPAIDQRGVLRPFDGDENGSAICDVGPVELPEPGVAAGLLAGVLGLGALERRRRARGAGPRGSAR